MRITGGRSIGDKIAILDQHASELYMNIRNSNSDVTRIAENINIPDFQVQRVKDHVFHNSHQLDRGVAKFDPDLEIANAWNRLEAGTHTESDLLIFRHEHFESRFEGIFNTDYSTAHEAANRAGHPSGLKELDIDFHVREILKK